MPAVEREITITYGGFAVGGVTERPLTGYIEHTTGKDTSSVEFTFWVSADTSEDFASACATAESAFRTPDQDLIITFGKSVIHSKKHDAGTGFDAEPEITKIPEEGTSARARAYRVRIDFGIPADKASRNGRRESAFSVEYSGSRRRTITFTGTWTAVGTTDALDQYTTQSVAWMASVRSDVGGSYERVSEEITPSTNDKTCEFVSVWREILTAQSDSGTDDTGIVDPTMTFRRVRSQPGDSIDPNVVRLVELECRFSCDIDQTVTKDLDGKWDAIKSWIVTQIQDYIDGGEFAAEVFDINFDEHENRLDATVRGLGVDSDTTWIVESIVSVRDRDSDPWKYVPAWTGKPYSAYRHPTFGELYRTVSWTYRLRGYIAQDEAKYKVRNKGREFASGENWRRIETEAEVEQRQIGTTPWTIDVSDVTSSVRYQYIEDAAREGVATPGGSGGSAASTPGSRDEEAFQESRKNWAINQGAGTANNPNIAPGNR